MCCCRHGWGLVPGNGNEDDVVDRFYDGCLGREHKSIGSDLHGEPNDHASTLRIGQPDDDSSWFRPCGRSRYLSQISRDQYLTGCHSLTEP